MNYTAEIDWFGTVRARLGYLVSDQLLLYATGGLAYGRVHVTAFATSAVLVPAGVGDPRLTTSPLGFIAAKNNVGWTVGAGIEGRFTYWLPPAWSWKLEYLYVDLGSRYGNPIGGGHRGQRFFWDVWDHHPTHGFHRPYRASWPELQI
jgi:outer membrane immunogenic protein